MYDAVGILVFSYRIYSPPHSDGKKFHLTRFLKDNYLTIHIYPYAQFTKIILSQLFSQLL